MKTLSIPFLVLVIAMGISGQAFAGPDLGGVMKAMSASVSKISDQISDSSKNAETAQLCDALVASIEQAKTFVPKKVSDLPADQQSAQTTEFVRQLSALEAKVGEIKADLLQNDNTAASAALTGALAIKSAGHKAFK